MTAAAGSARVAAGSAMDRLVARLQDVMPRRKPAYRRVTPLATRRETQRRAAMAALALIIVVGGLGLAVYAFGGSTPDEAISSVNAGQQAVDLGQGQPRQGVRSGHRSRRRRPEPGPRAPRRGVRAARRRRGGQGQGDHHRPAAQAGRGGPGSPVRRRPGRRRRRASRSSRPRVPTRSTCAASSAGRTARRTCSIARPASVYRIDLKAKKATLVARFGQKANGGDRRLAAVHRARRDVRPADPRLEERPVALAAGRRAPARAPWSGSTSTAPARGATTSRASGRTCATRLATCTTCTSSTRPSSRSSRTRRRPTAAASRARARRGWRRLGTCPR